MPYTLSPFRYPGGKTQLYLFTSHLLKLNKVNGTYIEPFAGGAGVAIKLLVNDKVNDIWINDYDKSIYSVWYAILNHPNNLIELINNVPFDFHTHNTTDQENINYWYKIKKIHENEKNYQNSIMNAFSTLMLNRLNVSGILSAGPIGGFNQNKTKIYVRFNKKTLINKILLINSYKDRIKLTRLDAFKLLPVIQEKMSSTKNTFIFMDPPYFKQGKHLYMSSFSKKSHYLLAKMIINNYMNLKWILTYDISEEILDAYSSINNKYTYYLSYSANNHNKGKFKEFLFASNKTQVKSFENVQLNRIEKSSSLK